MPTLVDVDTRKAYTWTTPTMDFGRDNTEVRSTFSEIPGVLWQYIDRHLFSIEYDARNDKYTITKHSNNPDIVVGLGNFETKGDYLRWNQRQPLNEEGVIEIELKIRGKLEQFRLFAFFKDPKPQAVYHTYPEEDSDWDVLGLVKNSSIDDVKEQFRMISRVFHPDKYDQGRISDANKKNNLEKYRRMEEARTRLVAKLRKEAIDRGVQEPELSKYSARFEPSNPYIV